MLRQVFVRLRSLLRRRRREADLDEEIRFHLAEETEERVALGMSRERARAAARRDFGNVTLIRELTRETWGWGPAERLLQDIRGAVRMMRRNPGLVVVSAMSLGLGIGLNAILYTGVSAIYGHEPTMIEPDRVVGVEPGNANQFSYPDYRDLLLSRIFDDAVGFRVVGLSLGSGRRATRVAGLAVTSNFFDVIGGDARIGRTFSAVDAGPEREPRVAVVTAGFWRTSLGGVPAAVGEAVVVNGEPFTVVGVLPDDYRAVTGWQGPDLYVPLSRLTVPAIDERDSPTLSVLGRLARGATPAEAQRAVNSFSEALDLAYPERTGSRGQPASVFPAATLQFRGVPPQFRLVATAAGITAGLVLLIACLNVAGLLMARATIRRHETSIRVAIGAGRGRVVQMTLMESLLLVGAGSAVGLPLAFALSRIPLPESMASLQGVMAFDAGLLPFMAAVVGATTLICGVVPAVGAMRADVVSALRQGGESATPRTRLRRMLVTAQVAMSFILVAAALLCVRSQIEIARMDLGFDIDHSVVARFRVDAGRYPGQARVRFAEQLVERIGRVTGVSSASPADLVPLGGNVLVRSFHPAGRTDIPGTRPDTFSVGPEYFRTLAIPLLRGRDFHTADRAGTPAVAIVNETYAGTYFPGRAVVGQRVQTADEMDAEVIGLVGDSRIGTIGETPRSVVYYPYAQRPSELVLHVRGAPSPTALVPAVQDAIEEVDGTVPVGVQTLRDAASLELTMRRAGMMIMGAMGVVGLSLAAIGLYGVMAGIAASRITEIGIRMAFGATRRRIRGEMLRRAFSVIAPGVAIGVTASLVLTPVFGTFLAGISSFDPVAFVGAAAVLLFVGLAAGYAPAERCARLDPMRALRRL